MSQKFEQNLLGESKESRRILSELDALLGPARSEIPGSPERKESMPITANKTVRELALEIPASTRVFEKLGIDYCCNGHKSLEEACADANVAINDVMRALDENPAVLGDAVPPDWNTAPLSELTDHILAKHHTYVKSEVPRIESLIAKVVAAHGNRHSELRELQVAFSELTNELAGHLMKEEQILFPYVKQMATGRGSGACCFGTVQNPISVMMMEHDNAGEKLREMRQLTYNYALPNDACASYAALFSALVEFEQDLHQHIHLENNILFPRAVRMEAGAG